MLVDIQHHLLKILLFIHWIVLASFWKSTGHDFEGLLGFQFCSIDLYVCLMPLSHGLDYCGFFVVNFEISQFSFLKIVLAVLDPLHFCINFRIHFSDFCKKREKTGVLILCFFPADQFGDYWHVSNIKSHQAMNMRCFSIY